MNREIKTVLEKQMEDLSRAISEKTWGEVGNKRANRGNGRNGNRERRRFKEFEAGGGNPKAEILRQI